jgi:hypothetical protein
VTDLRDQLGAFEDAARRLTVQPRRAAVALPRTGLGLLLRRMRLDAGLTLDQVGQAAHITRKGVCSRELHGRALPATALVEHLGALGYHVIAVPDRRTAL